jgi:hypothetical protein
MKKLLYTLALLGAIFAPSFASAQSYYRMCIDIPARTNTPSRNSCVEIPANTPTTNRAVAITTGGTFQIVVPASTSKLSVTIQNNNSISTGTEYCYVYVGSGTATTSNSIILAPGGSYQRYFPFLPSDDIQATCTTTNDTIYVDTQ